MKKNKLFMLAAPLAAVIPAITVSCNDTKKEELEAKVKLLSNTFEQINANLEKADLNETSKKDLKEHIVKGKNLIKEVKNLEDINNLSDSFINYYIQTLLKDDKNNLMQLFSFISNAFKLSQYFNTNLNEFYKANENVINEIKNNYENLHNFKNLSKLLLNDNELYQSINSSVKNLYENVIKSDYFEVYGYQNQYNGIFNLDLNFSNSFLKDTFEKDGEKYINVEIKFLYDLKTETLQKKVLDLNANDNVSSIFSFNKKMSEEDDKQIYTNRLEKDLKVALLNSDTLLYDEYKPLLQANEKANTDEVYLDHFYNEDNFKNNFLVNLINVPMFSFILYETKQVALVYKLSFKLDGNKFSKGQSLVIANNSIINPEILQKTNQLNLNNLFVSIDKDQLNSYVEEFNLK
ncbi:hypothetical protein FJO69_02150 [[Mycoplasma] falconis]|uniref:Lipoprotein n=1 Tax=[Mycoplasma] falconis TaxID=92403 RepID=A0A501X9Y4_9BACT|nr:hypothetical protein [[Mycoplasma] falconis]TPE57193.1 hypothetical protein FJO69_02150 [[Mycoplasma] falconis]